MSLRRKSGPRGLLSSSLCFGPSVSRRKPLQGLLSRAENMLLRAAFTVLLLLVGGVSAVAPPENVTLSCSNVNVSVSWEHRGQTPRTSFSVRVEGRPVAETTERQYDLTRFVWASQRRCLGFHAVSVAAKEGGDQSNSTSITFSFNRFKPADVKCKLDFPTVDLSESASGAMLSFMNPLRFYKELKEASKTSHPTVEFTASSNHSDFQQDCTEKDGVCRLDISFPDGAEKCVKTLTGVLLFTGHGQVEFRDREHICASSSTDAGALTLLLLLLLLFVVIVVAIIIAVWTVKGWTTETPKPVILGLWWHYINSWYATVSQDNISPIVLIDGKPCKNPSVSTEEEEKEEGAALQGGSASAPLYTERRFLEDSADDSEKTETVSLEEDEEEELSPYDCPHNLQVDMGDGDMVTCYSKRT
ncbi:interferon gamma receptor 1 [Clinocottus analis]|uniref:interferon gamma receptor 1 n=1 Tax=Clinocottus analis TaxID=304258 RepID=UPI0035C21279